jgi:hypothetical protein
MCPAQACGISVRARQAPLSRVQAASSRRMPGSRADRTEASAGPVGGLLKCGGQVTRDTCRGPWLDSTTGPAPEPRRRSPRRLEPRAQRTRPRVPTLPTLHSSLRRSATVRSCLPARRQGRRALRQVAGQRTHAPARLRARADERRYWGRSSVNVVVWVAPIAATAPSASDGRRSIGYSVSTGPTGLSPRYITGRPASSSQSRKHARTSMTQGTAMRSTVALTHWVPAWMRSQILRSTSA